MNDLGDLRNEANLLAGWACDLLVELCEIDTSITGNIPALREAEDRILMRLARAAADIVGDDACRRLPIDGRIGDHEDYTWPEYAGDLADQPDRVYAGRHNLLVAAGPQAKWLLNAHVDTVPPHLPPRLEEAVGIVHGRGACDDKGGVVSILLALRLLAERGRADDVHLLFSIDEETGGNGTLGALPHLSLADGARVIVAEPTDLLAHPANRGAVWFRISIRAERVAADIRSGVFASVGTALARASREFRSTSSHELFSGRDVSFCLGILGQVGDHPASACAQVVLSWPAGNVDHVAIATAALDSEPAVDHWSKEPEAVIDSGGVALVVHALPGHMGSHDRDTDAIAKSAVIIRAIEDAGGGLPSLPDDATELVIEGGQGFLPDRSIEEAMAVVQTAVQAGLDDARDRYELEGSDVEATVTFDRLHNRAYASREDGQMAAGLASAVAELTGRPRADAGGWKASCDARLMALLSDDVVTFGPGRLEDAHGPDEQVRVGDVVDAGAAIAIAILRASDEKAGAA